MSEWELNMFTDEEVAAVEQMILEMEEQMQNGRYICKFLKKNFPKFY